MRRAARRRRTFFGAFAQANPVQLGIPVAYPTPGGAKKARTLSIPDTFTGESHSAPAPTPEPGKLEIYGRARGYDFQRVNHVQNASKPNRHAYGFSVEPW